MLAGALLLLSIATPQIEVITMGPGPYLYSFWGHAAIRVVDVERGDLVYNFGSVDFSGDFFVRMMRGEVEAFVGVSSFESTAQTYSDEDRTLTRRVLDLTPSQARSLGLNLARSVRGGRRQKYVYHHFHDNCVTRVAVEIDRALDGALSKDAQIEATGRTLRDEAVGAIQRNGLWAVAVDLALGGATDQPITVWDSIFLPSRFDELLDRTTVDGHPLVKETIEVNRSTTIHPDDDPIWPWLWVYLFLLAPICALIVWRPRLGAAIFGIVIGTLGIALALLWAPTEYDFTQRNWNVLVLPATHWLFAICAARRTLWSRTAPKLRIYAMAHTAVLLVLAVLHFAGVIVQSIGPALALSLPPVALLIALLPTSDMTTKHLGFTHTIHP